MKRLRTLLLALMFLLSMTACSAKSNSPSGKYLGIRATTQGLTIPMDKAYAGETWLELKSSGKGIAMVDAKQFPMVWSLDGETFTITVDGVTSTGTLKDGIITVDLMNYDSVLEFLKEGVNPTPPAPPTYNHAGYWEVIRLDRNDSENSADEEDLLPWAATDHLYLELMEDGTGELFIKDSYPLTWIDGTITFTKDNVSISYTAEGDLLFLEMLNVSMVFRKGEKPTSVLSEMEDAGFVQFMEHGVIYPYTTICSDVETLSTTGEAIVTSYEIFDSAEGYLGTDGYEWRVVKMEVRFFDQNAQDYGMVTFSNAEDYYTTKLHDDTYQDIKEEDNSTYHQYRTIYQEQEETIYEKVTTYWGGWQENEDGRLESITYYEWAMRVPVGYDGCVVGLRDGRLQWLDGTYITDYDPSNFLLFRLN